MSLNFDLTKCTNLKERSGNLPINKAIIFRTMLVGISRITEKNVEEFVLRSNIVDKAIGFMLFETIDGKPVGRGLTLEEITDRIGLNTNASSLTRPQFLNWAKQALWREAVDELRISKKAKE